MRTAEIDLVNTGDKPATYRISLTQRRMTETGGIVAANVAEPGELFATGMVRVTPSQIILKPQEDQVVRLTLRLPADLAPGEYRSHLQFNGVPDRLGPADDGPAVTEGVGITLKPIYGLSMPVIIRRGDLKAEVKLSDLKYTPPTGTQPASVSLVMNRTGTMSVYGDFVVTLQTADGKSQVVDRVNGVAVYCPNAIRRVVMDLAIPPGTVTAGASLHIGYFKQEDEHATAWAQETITLDQ